MGPQGSLDHEIARLLDAEPQLLPLLPELLADLESLGSSPEVIVELLLPLDLAVGSSALDLGCGKGAVSLALGGALPLTITGIDAFEPFVEAARAEAARRGLEDRCRFEVGDLRARLRGDGAFDVVVLASVGPILGDLRRTLGALAGCVRPGGWVVLQDCALRRRARPRAGYEAYVPLDATRRTIEASGLQVVREIVHSVEEVRAANRATTAAIARRAEALVRRRPEVAKLVYGYVERQRAECRFLEESTVEVSWLLRRA